MGLTLAVFLSSWAVHFEWSKGSDEKDSIILSMSKYYVDNIHYLAKRMDDEFSREAFDLYLKRMDYNKRFYLKSDIRELEKYRDKIDDEINNETLEFFHRANEILDLRRAEVEGFYKELLEQPFDFTGQDNVETDHDKRDYASSKSELKAIWKTDLKYQTLSRLYRKVSQQEKLLANPDTTIEVKSIAEMEIEAREGVRKNMENYFIRVHKINDKDRISLYVNSILNVFDPHTSYFPPEDKENFDISMSGKLEGIGARLSQPGNEIKVVSIVPGSASALQGDLKVDDIITAVAQGDSDFVSVEEMRLDDAIKLIRGPKGTKVRLQVTHKNGVEQIIPIIRDVVIIEETYAKSFILNEGGAKIGYINLPKFYTDFNDRNGRTAWKDVEKELNKLKAQKVEGVILDLRNNGGGSLRDVVDIVGLFIDQGPVVQVRGRNNELKVLEDKRPGIVYDGPLVVMVNEYSASASEILAAAIQDYDRGVVVGSGHTYGKGTVQRFYDLDRMLNDQYAKYKPLGAIKITMQKFYRIDGGSTQLKGVKPDIILPDLYSYIETGEREMDYAMKWDKINPAEYKEWNATWNVSQLNYSVEKRIKTKNFFTTVDEMARDLEKRQDLTLVSLNLEQYSKEQKIYEEQSDKYDDLFVAIEGFEVKSLAEDETAIAGDSVKVKINKDQMKDISEDPYIYESANIIRMMQKKSRFKKNMQYVTE